MSKFGLEIFNPMYSPSISNILKVIVDNPPIARPNAQPASKSSNISSGSRIIQAKNPKRARIVEQNASVVAVDELSLILNKILLINAIRIDVAPNIIDAIPNDAAT